MNAGRILVAALLAATPLFAQKPSPIELGFKAQKVYDFGSVDSVNAMNGNVIINLPIGLTYPVSAHLSYGLALVYNSKVWDYSYLSDAFDPSRTYLWAKPNIRSNAGPGWRVSMGRLLAPQDATMTSYREDVHGWIYEGPSGDEHALSSGVYGAPHDENAAVQFTSDSSHLRMVVVNSTMRRVEFPDGAIHTFTFQRNAWRLTRMEDRFNNAVTIAYSYWSTTDDRVTAWTIDDVHGRRHTVAFRYFSDMSESVDRGMNVDFIDLQSVGGFTVRYTFSYQVTAVSFGPYHDAPQEWTAASAWFPLLTAITLPDSTGYNLSYYTTPLDGSQGLVQELTLPTLGRITYGYQIFRFPDPADPCRGESPRSYSPGVRTRAFEGDTWTYFQTLAPLADTIDPTPGADYPCQWPEGGRIPRPHRAAGRAPASSPLPIPLALTRAAIITSTSTSPRKGTIATKDSAPATGACSSSASRSRRDGPAGRPPAMLHPL